jgi:hypothetical protein
VILQDNLSRYFGFTHRGQELLQFKFLHANSAFPQLFLAVSDLSANGRTSLLCGSASVCVCVRARAHGTCNRKMRCRTYLVVTPSTLSKLYALFASGDLRIDLGRSAASNMMEWVSLFRSSEEIDIIAGILSRFKCYFKKAQQEGSSDPAQL